ncbi:reverse transcriptase domain-containing protein [Streptomyces sp. NPDC053560]|uniref:reverse transcriptase domain-containing protein n=1 Tax=Streptomyces sp. NPDC053560 TaxID=3365711 RepID=UPI0037D654E3
MDRRGRRQGVLRRDLAPGPHGPSTDSNRRQTGPGLAKAFLKSGILGEDRTLRKTDTGTPQGSILSPLLSNVALSVLDEHIAHGPGGPSSTFNERQRRRRRGLPNCQLIRYADDWCLVVSGTQADAEMLKEETAEVLSTMGLRLSPEKNPSHKSWGVSGENGPSGESTGSSGRTNSYDSESPGKGRRRSSAAYERPKPQVSSACWGST